MRTQTAQLKRWPSRTASLSLLLAAVTWVTGCTTHPRPGLAHGVLHGWNEVVGGHVSRAETTLVPSDGGLQGTPRIPVMGIEIDSFGGDVVIKADPKAETASIEATRWGTHGYGRRDESEASLDSITVSYAVEDRPEGKTIVVKATSTAPEPWFQHVDLVVIVPRLGAAIVRSSRGHVYVTDFTDGVDIETTKGDVRAVSNHVLSHPSTILNAEGSINWRAPAGSAAMIEAEAVNGTVRVRVRDGKWLAVDSRNDHDSMYGSINQGKNLVILRTVDGDVRVFVGPNPTQTGSFGE